MRFLMTSIKRVTVCVCVCVFSDAEKIYCIKGSLTVRCHYCKCGAECGFLNYILLLGIFAFITRQLWSDDRK